MRHLLGIPEYNVEAFKSLAKGAKPPSIRLYGKSDAPPAPDYANAAKETAAGNLESAMFATNANRINQYTPYGSLTYKRPETTYDTAAYESALAKYNNLVNQQQDYASQQQAASAPPVWDAGSQDYVSAPAPSKMPMLEIGEAPKLEDFKNVGDGSGWEQTMTLTPQAQAALDEQLALNKKYAETANIGFDKARSIFENPQLDLAGIPARAINVGQTAQDAIMSRLSPQLAQQEEALAARLANQGITLGSDAYTRENSLQGQRANDLMLQAALQGINLDQANRASALQEQAYLQDRPLNLINALRTGAQVQSPQFNPYAQQAATAGPDTLGAQTQQYNAAIGATNASNANVANTAQGLIGAAMLTTMF